MDEVPEARAPVVPIAVREHVQVVHFADGSLRAGTCLRGQPKAQLAHFVRGHAHDEQWQIPTAYPFGMVNLMKSSMTSEQRHASA